MRYDYLVPMGDITTVNDNKITIVRAEEEYVFDGEQKRFVDLRSGLWNVNLGYKKELHAAISRRFTDQLLKKLTYLDIHSFHHPLYQEYAVGLSTFVDKEGTYPQIIYTNSGSECTELTLKLSRQINKGKKKTLAFSQGYHGTFWGGMSISGLDQEVTEVYSPKLSNMEFMKLPENDLEEKAFFEHIEQHHREYGAMIIEPILGSAGVKMSSIRFLNKLGRLLQKYMITVIFDEVATGFYRTGKPFYFHYLDFKPDMINLSKGINNGILPFGAVLVSNDIVCKLKKEEPEHFSTQNGNLLGVISAHETLCYYQQHEAEIAKNIQKLNELILAEMSFNGISVRGIGCMFAVPIDDPQALSLIMQSLEQAGILCYQYFNSVEDNGLTLMPSFYTDHKKMQQILKRIAKAVKSYA
ncbi:aminotransferase class III-fold pyridoxal phosphate-dependent enzyme [Enterococcus sp. AZ192]|uniref:aminotransferase class III-fold pyridoxal phosphate-dependent enzyme n=1 Tax=unclassified Enterococcus TaxID=2608891 RepID=UPI003D2BBDEC